MKRLLAWFRRKLVYDEMADVRDFNKKFLLTHHIIPGPLKKRVLAQRLAFLHEELAELTSASDTQDLPLQVDALVDLVYVIKGTAVMMGLPWEELWQDVHRANMAKELQLRQGAGDYKNGVVKPPHWKEPTTGFILFKNGYMTHHYLTNGQVDEEKCYA